MNPAMGANALSGSGSYDLSATSGAHGDVRFGSNYGPTFGGSGLNLSTPVLLGAGALVALYFVMKKRG